jgi:hypothetical protein
MRLPDPFNILATADRIDAAATEEEVRTIVDNWRAAHWGEWALIESARRTDDGKQQFDKSWLVECLPDELDFAEIAAADRLRHNPAHPSPRG